MSDRDHSRDSTHTWPRTGGKVRFQWLAGIGTKNRTPSHLLVFCPGLVHIAAMYEEVSSSGFVQNLHWPRPVKYSLDLVCGSLAHTMGWRPLYCDGQFTAPLIQTRWLDLQGLKALYGSVWYVSDCRIRCSECDRPLLCYYVCDLTTQEAQRFFSWKSVKVLVLCRMSSSVVAHWKNCNASRKHQSSVLPV